ncbi:hypothetical protein [Helicobacter canis]|uniref:hypothetical protein n=1 Tax=Helicobacter canis TaxID=29419 RepID=UPI0029429F71|nr:hypothetical protein [Helicobacter canis]
MRNCCFQAVGAGIYLGDNEQAHRAESAIYRYKPNPSVKSLRAQVLPPPPPVV